jgi:Ser/Thr protein kinase RdoA (MazF antagonist)
LVTQALEAAAVNGNLALARHATTLLGGATASRCVTHGDFVPWNILVTGGRTQVFDWEYGAIDGVPGWDELFFEVQVALVIRRYSSADIATVVAKVIQPGFAGFSNRQARGLAVLVLLALADRYTRRGDEARQRVVNDVATRLA